MVYVSSNCGLQNVIDGDLCEQYNSLEPAKRRSIAEELDRTPSEVSPTVQLYYSETCLIQSPPNHNFLTLLSRWLH